MGEENKKIKANSWVLLFFLFIAVAFSLLFRITSIISETEKEEVETGLEEKVSEYADELRDILADMRNLGDTVGRVAGKLDVNDEDGIKDVLSALASNSANYMAIICNETGAGYYQINGSGEVVGINMSSVDYFDDILAHGNGYFFVSDDSIYNKSAIVCISSIYTGQKISGYFLQYYNTHDFRNIAKRADFDTDTKIYLVTGTGDIMAYMGKDGHEIPEGMVNLWNELNQRKTEGDIVEDILWDTGSKNTATNYAQLKEGEFAFVSARLGISDWRIVTELTADYVEQRARLEAREIITLIDYLIGVLVVFSITRIVVSIITLGKERQSKADLEARADTDLLTDLYNKAATERKIKAYITANPETPGLIFVLDIDNFKKINDTMGHAFGDEVLRAVGTLIKTEFRASDIIGRTGGDEFTIFLKNVKDEEEIRIQVERILRFFSNLQVGEYVKYSPNASIGAAVFPVDAHDFDGLYKAADAALYVAKKRGKNQLAFYRERD